MVTNSFQEGVPVLFRNDILCLVVREEPLIGHIHFFYEVRSIFIRRRAATTFLLRRSVKYTEVTGETGYVLCFDPWPLLEKKLND